MEEKYLKREFRESIAVGEGAERKKERKKERERERERKGRERMNFFWACIVVICSLGLPLVVIGRVRL